MAVSLRPANVLRDFEFCRGGVDEILYLSKYYVVSYGKYVMPVRKILMPLT
jgi:hypothetical protein